jgi:hypothetical protein
MSFEKVRGLELLKEGKSYKEISQELNVPKSTISGWFFSLTGEEKRKIKAFRINNWRNSVKDFQISLRQKTLATEKAIEEENSEKINCINKKDLLFIGASLYWAEGSKSNRWQIQFSNSDPEMIRLMMKFFAEVCGIKREKFYMQMILYKNLDESKALKYWSRITNIPKHQFKKACYSQSRSSQRKRNKRKLPFGTLQIRILDKKLTHQVYGYILGLKNWVKNN